MLSNRAFRTVLYSASALLVLAIVGCGGGQPGEYEERTAVARFYVYTSSGYEGRDTASPPFLSGRAGRTRVVARSQQRGLSDSTPLAEKEEPWRPPEELRSAPATPTHRRSGQ